jgi:hypothetical protein
MVHDVDDFDAEDAASADDAADEAAQAEARRSILERLARKELSAEEAATALRALGGDR